MTSFDWQFPYPSQRMPVLARNVVATSQPLAAQAGLRMLQKGGNAVDAILATAAALGLDVHAITEQLQADAIKAFASSFDQLVATLGEKRRQMLTTAS